MSGENNISMNDELRRWIIEKSKNSKSIEFKEEDKSNKPSGKCEICGERNATSVCLKCGKSVCNSCYFKIINVCKKCVTSDIAAKWDGSRPDWEKELGVEWVG